MAKGDKQDVAKAKTAAAKNSKLKFKEGRHGPYGATTKQVNAERKADAKKSGYSQPKVTKGTDGFKMVGKGISAKKPSVAAKQGVKNKLKTQGKAATQSGRGYSRTGKK